MVSKSLMKAPPLATEKRKAALRMGKKSVIRSMNVGFVHSKRETETLIRARQLVFNSDSLAAPGGHPGELHSSRQQCWRSI
uniref:Uncharacterized protein n=1 Tax=Salix viminalis TaxID=40686 RepID=A0A6N2MXV1_SALVM